MTKRLFYYDENATNCYATISGKDYLYQLIVQAIITIVPKTLVLLKVPLANRNRKVTLLRQLLCLY